MINIIIACTPNYENKQIINTIKKEIDVVTQFVMLYNSIKDNWKFDYRINLFYNKDIPFNEHDHELLESLDIDMYAVEPDWKTLPYAVRFNGSIHPLKNPSTHRLLLDCDMIALSEPTFDLSCDWQAMYAKTTFDAKYCEYINQKFGYNIPLSYKTNKEMFFEYNIMRKPYEELFPHFNGGAFLVREELCEKFKESTSPSYDLAHDTNVPHHIRHMGVQYGASYALIKMSKNWKPFEPGFNYCLKASGLVDGVETFEKLSKDEISLLHYCGNSAYPLCVKHFRDAVEKYKPEVKKK